jgi:hypothetical protein
MFLFQLLGDALERLLHRADLEPRRRIGEPLPLEAVEPGPRLRGLSLQIRDREIEIEKALAGSGGSDTSGVSQGMLGALLTFMQDEGATGCIFIGPPGAAKSAPSKTGFFMQFSI